MSHQYGLVHDRHDARDLRFSATSATGLLKLPSLVDLRPLCSPVRDQGNLGSCTGFAIITGFRECLATQVHTFVELSPLFEYYWERYKERTVSQDAGAQIRDGMKVLQKIGAAPESSWPYDISKFTVQPPTTMLTKMYTIAAFHRINNAIEIKQALAHNRPVVVGISVFDSFETDEVAKTGVVPIPDQTNENYLGGHAVCVVGYDDSKHVFIVKNSWGVDWGIAGYFTLPYGFFNPSANLVMDMWTGHA
jgi:C1A family cysteine protease